MSKVRSSSVKSYSTSFSYSERAMNSRVHHDQNQRLMLKSYITGTDSCIGYKRSYNHYLFENVVNELNDCIDKEPHVIPYRKWSKSIHVKVNGKLLNKYDYLLKI